ncbi:kinesin family member 15 [Microdochium nivale]|nr:kinesin family member 15 [Microdochium nivale]
MASSPPGSPTAFAHPRPMSAMIRPSSQAPRSSSRMSIGSKAGRESRASDEESRTAVKVAVRVRPPLKHSDPGYDLIPQRFQRSMVQTTSNTNIAIESPQGKKIFVFDRVFSSDTEQDGVWEYLSECIPAFLQGYNVSLLAYGQSGAGKSYTMGTSGPKEQGKIEVMGVIPRAAIALFEHLDGGAAKSSNRSSMSQLRTPNRYSMAAAPPVSMPKVEKTWQLRATYVEIYNEQLRDLLLPENAQPHERNNVTIREDTKGNIILTGLHQVDINSVDDLLNALNFGSSIRQTDATAINAKSSRSHAVFSLNLVQRKGKAVSAADRRLSMPLESMSGSESWVTTDSKLHFVDLAGSERLKNTGAQGERAKEGISINAGLAALGKVISQLSSRQAGSHVSYRDSRLTRLLQDSLGGNAITYMIACVTPAEFHLSETLNTVQYAQRARAIQSKPRIQATEEGDKQAIIDRLKAEVAFLREQIRSADRAGSERRPAAASDRPERHGEREKELEIQLLDTQENYSTLSQRHAKLIAEMAKARDNEAAVNHHEMSESADERISRSNSFAQAVEQVVLEYEKTIQSLEQSLSSTRTTLSNTETSLLEKETKCAYMETINTQLQTRIAKLADREANTENYLHDLETKLDGHTSGEEKNAAIVLELRKEIARIRENEAGCEDYISTLEERLAEADQDTELMQREIDRLEQLIERQRSLGKLDNLLSELDNINSDNNGAEREPESAANINGHHRSFSERSTRSHVSRPSLGIRDHLPDVTEGAEDDMAEQTASVEDKTQDNASGERSLVTLEEQPQSPAQSRFVADKLEDVTQELVDLRVEHENTLNEFEDLHLKYEETLKTLAELQDQVDEARHPKKNRNSALSVNTQQQTRSPSFLSEGKGAEIKDGTISSSRSLSSELSSAMASPATSDASDTDVLDTPTGSDVHTASHEDATPASELTSEDVSDEIQKLKALAVEKEAVEKELAEKYAQLEQQHQETLDMVEELKTAVAKAKHQEPASPRTAGPVIRRKSSQNVMVIDRAHRSFASLRNIAADNFEDQPDVMQNFEVNLNTAMHELHARSERVQELEADIANAKREMDTKMTIISGLTRERSSLKVSPMDMSVVASLREQLERNESQLKQMQTAHIAREAELSAEINALRTSTSGDAQEKPVTNERTINGSEAIDQEQKITGLQAELTAWEAKHQSALDSMQSTETQMRATIEQLESEMAAARTRFGEAQLSAKTEDESKDIENRQNAQLGSLQTELDGYKKTIDSNAAKVAELEKAHAATREQLTEAMAARDMASTEAATHKDVIAELESQITGHEKTLVAHQGKLDQLNDDHAREIKQIQASCKEEHDAQVRQLKTEHAENVKLLEDDVAEAREELTRVATQLGLALGLEVSVDKISDHIENLVAAKSSLDTEQKRSGELEDHLNELATINNTVMRDLEAVKSWLNDMLSTGDKAKSAESYPSVQEQLGALKKRMGDLDNKNKKHSRLVEELEDQLQTNYDQAQATNNRLSTLQTERHNQLEEATIAKNNAVAELEALRNEIAVLQARVDDADPKRANSINSQVRKTASVTSLPSPPPAIPLPPIPGPASPTQNSPNGRPQSDLALAQIREDQEARIKSIDKALFAERQLTQTLEDALTNLERQSNKVKADCDAWRKRAQELEGEVKELKDKAPKDDRWRDSLHQIEEERKKRQDAERARTHLEERMNAINQKKKKKGSLNCF